MASSRLPVTLALVSYQKAREIGLVIESAARGSLRPDLVVVSDDGSTDGTPDVAEEACRRFDLPCRVIRHQRSGFYRLQTMRNAGVAEALDGIVMLSDSDCLLGELTLESHREIHERHRNAVGTGARFEFLTGTGGAFTSMYSTLEFASCPHHSYVAPYGANLSFRKSLWRELGGFDRSYEGRYGLDDHEFVLRAERQGAIPYSDPGAFVVHCPHETVFGHRNSGSNANLFWRQFARDHAKSQAWFVRELALPCYWRGDRKAPLLGAERFDFDAWGAPPGYSPPIHLRVVVDHSVLTQPVEQLLSDWSDANLTQLQSMVRGLPGGLILRSAPAHHLCERLRRTIDATDRCSPALRKDLGDWLAWSRGLAPMRFPAAAMNEPMGRQQSRPTNERACESV